MKKHEMNLLVDMALKQIAICIYNRPIRKKILSQKNWRELALNHFTNMYCFCKRPNE